MILIGIDSRSEHQDHFFLICVTNDYGTLLELSTKTEAILLIAKSYEKKVSRPLTITIAQRYTHRQSYDGTTRFSPSFDYPVKKQSWIAGGMRTVKFIHSATAVLMVRITVYLRRRAVIELVLAEAGRSEQIT